MHEFGESVDPNQEREAEDYFLSKENRELFDQVGINNAAKSRNLKAKDVNTSHKHLFDQECLNKMAVSVAVCLYILYSTSDSVRVGRTVYK